MSTLILFLISVNSSYFLKLSPGVMSQGLGGVSIMIDEGLSAFHNPANVERTKFNFTLARWLYSTNYFSMGACYENNLLGISYLDYGSIQGYDQYGSATNEFTPFDFSLVVARKLGSFGIFLKTFGEKIDSLNFYGICAGVSSYVDYGNVALGAKIDNLGKEFAKNTAIPFTAALGLKVTLPKNIDIFIESKAPALEINAGLLYEYYSIKLLFGTRYLMPENLVQQTGIDLSFSDFSFASGMIVQIENYEIGYSFVYSGLSNAHQFSITLIP